MDGWKDLSLYSVHVWMGEGLNGNVMPQPHPLHVIQDYPRLSLHSVSSYNLRSSAVPVMLVNHKRKWYFSRLCVISFHTLPSEVRSTKGYATFCKAVT